MRAKILVVDDYAGHLAMLRTVLTGILQRSGAAEGAGAAPAGPPAG